MTNTFLFTSESVTEGHPDKKLSNFSKQVEIIYTSYRNIRKNLKNFNFYKRAKAYMLANKFPN